MHRAPASGAAEVEAAVAAARRAADEGFEEWGGLSATTRVQYLLALATKLEEHAPYIAELEATDMGKPIIDAHGDIARCISEIEECVGLAEELDALQDKQVFESDDVLGTQRYEPIGVVAAITPWNFPLLVTVMKLAPALTAGNAVVLKPSEYSPLTTMFAAKLCDEVGFPRGVVNFISGARSDLLAAPFPTRWALSLRSRYGLRGGRSALAVHRHRHGVLHGLRPDGQHDHGRGGEEHRQAAARAGWQIALRCLRGRRHGRDAAVGHVGLPLQHRPGLRRPDASSGPRIAEGRARLTAQDGAGAGQHTTACARLFSPGCVGSH